MPQSDVTEPMSQSRCRRAVAAEPMPQSERAWCRCFRGGACLAEQGDDTVLVGHGLRLEVG